MDKKLRSKIWIIVIIIVFVVLIFNIIRALYTAKRMQDMESDLKSTVKFIELPGTYVNYFPERGTYIAEASYTGVDSNVKNQVFNTDTDIKWRVWKIDDKNLYLISDRGTNMSGYNNTGELLLAGKNGYNNGEMIIDNVCKECYSNSSINAVARNIKLEDLQEIAKNEFVDVNVEIEWKRTNDYDMIMGKLGERAFWLSTSSTVKYGNTVELNLQKVTKDGISRELLYTSGQDSFKNSAMLRPIITIPIERCKFNETEAGYDISFN